MADIFDLFKKITKEREETPGSSGPITHILVGLGNPGNEYYDTRHNTGFLMVDYVSQKANIRLNRSKFKALVGDGSIGGHRVLLMKPQTYMNASGEAVVEAMKFYKIAPENVLIFSDDISLPVGRIRVRRSGSDGGQRGLRSIIYLSGSDQFPRIRFGIGEKPSPDYPLADWVLSHFTDEDKKALFSCFEKGYEGVLKVLDGDVDGAMQICNGK